MRKFLSALFIAVFVLGLFSFSGARICYAKSMLLVDVDNDVDPVNGDPITVKKFHTSYDGKKYWFASYKTLKEFKKNPEKYVEGVKAPVKKKTTTYTTTTTTTTPATPTTTKEATTEKEEPKKKGWFGW